MRALAGTMVLTPVRRRLKTDLQKFMSCTAPEQVGGCYR